MLSVSVIAQSAILTKIKIKMVCQTPHKMLPSASQATALASLCLLTMSQSLIACSYRKLQPQWQELSNITSNKTQGKEHTGLLLPTVSAPLTLHQHLPGLNSCYSWASTRREGLFQDFRILKKIIQKIYLYITKAQLPLNFKSGPSWTFSSWITAVLLSPFLLSTWGTWSLPL